MIRSSVAMALNQRSLAPPSQPDIPNKETEKPTTATRRRHYVPDDIVLIEILTWLPAKSLCRFKPVSRTWCDTISSDPLFVLNQSRRQTYLSSGMVSYCNKSHSLAFLSTPGASVGVPDPLLGFRVAKIIDLLASVHGLLLLLLGLGHELFLYVCNPATGKGERIPAGGGDLYFFYAGLAFDPSSSADRYALINPICFSGKSEQFPLRYRFHKFSSSTGQWTTPSAEMTEVCSTWTPSTAHFAGGVVYWCCGCYILSYDTFKEAAEEMKLPWADSPSWKQELGLWEEKLTCTRVEGDFVQVWVMRTKGNWETRHNVLLTVVERTLAEFPDPSREMLFGPVPIAYEGGKNIYLRMQMLVEKGKETESEEKEVLVVFDTESKNSTVLGEIGIDIGKTLAPPLSYHNSLVALPQLQRRSRHSTAE